MGIFNSLDKFVNNFFNNLSNEAVDGLTDMAKNAKLPPRAIKAMNDMEEDGIDLRYWSKNDMNHRHDVNKRFNELSLVLQNGILYSDEVFSGINSMGDLTSDFITKDNERFSGMVYFIMIDSEFNVKEVSWVRNFENGVLSNSSEKYRYNQLVERSIFDNGNIKKIENFVRIKDKVVGTISSITEFETSQDFTKTIFEYGKGNYQVEVYKNNKPHGDWLDYKIFNTYSELTYLASRKKYND